MRRIRPEQVAERTAAHAVADCDSCAAAIVTMTPPGFLQWRRKAGLPQKGPCAKAKRIRQRLIGQDPALAAGLQLDEYTLWLQDALRKERAEAGRLRRALTAASKAVERPAENVVPPPPKGLNTYQTPKTPVANQLNPAAPQKPATEEDEEGGVVDFNAASPLTPSERQVLRMLHAAPDGRASSMDLQGTLHRRSAYQATKTLRARGHITIQQSLQDTRLRIYRLTPTGRLATKSVAAIHEPAEAPA